MKLPCELIRDLLPLYHDGVCSEASKTVVEEHLKTCDACTATLTALDAQIEIPKLDADEAKPLKAIRRKSLRNSALIGLTAFVLVLLSILYLAVLSSVKIDSDEFTIHTVSELSDGRIYVEYSHPYAFTNISIDITGTKEGEYYQQYYRPILAYKASERNQTIERQIIDPEMNRVWYGYDESTLITAFYLGHPNHGEPLLVWSEDMEVPKASPEIEKLYMHLYPNFF